MELPDLVLVTGATGTVGSHVAAGLAGRVETRAGVRDPARADAPDAVEPVVLDFEKPETWGAALDGVDALFLIRPPQVSTDCLTEFADAAVRVGVEHVAYLSVLGAERNPLLPHRRVERHLSGLGVATTFLRASFFMQNLVEVHPEEVARGEIAVPAGDGRTSFVDARDVAAVAATVLADPDRSGGAYDLTGPNALTYHEVATVLSEVLDRRVEYTDPSIPRFVVRRLRAGDPLPFVVVMVGIYTTARLGFAGRVADGVMRVLDREPRTLADFAADYADALRPA
jgi:uncharacterized protein YbjT (DUF2867 family)